MSKLKIASVIAVIVMIVACATVRVEDDKPRTPSDAFYADPKHFT